MRIQRQIDLLFVCLIVIAILFAFVPAAFASGDCHDGSCNTVDAGSNVDTAVSNRTRAVSLSGGDMDIEDSYRSYSVAFGLWQGTQVNLLELARQLALEGNHEAAARLRCQASKKIRNAFGGRAACFTALNRPIVIPELPEEQARGGLTIFEAERLAEHEETEQRHDQELQNVQGELTVARQEITALRRELSSAQIPQDVIQAIRANEQRQANTRAILYGEESDSE